MEILTYEELLEKAENLTDLTLKQCIRALNGAYFNQDLRNAIYETETDLQATIIVDRITNAPHSEATEAERKYKQAKRIKELYDTLPELPRNPYIGLAENLTAFVAGTNDDVLGTIIQTKALPKGGTPPIWIKKRGSRADAWRFAEWAHLKVSQFNKCFTGTRIAHNDKCTPLQGSISDILDKFPQP